MGKKYLIVITGPTAVGKTDLSLELAEVFNAEIFSADSRQLYTELGIAVAKPSESALERIQHHFVNHISIDSPYSAGIYEQEFAEKIESYFAEKDFALLVGGSGLFIKAALEGFDKFPAVSTSIKEEVRALYEKEGLEALQDKLAILDPAYSKQVDLQNSRRLIRALEVCMSSGKAYSSFTKNEKQDKRKFEVIRICLTRARELLYQRINERVNLMMKAGLKEEARSFYQKRDLPALQTVGYQEFMDHFEGLYDIVTAVDLIKRNTRRYAKRQMTWFKNQMQWEYIDAACHEDVHAFIKKSIL